MTNDMFCPLVSIRVMNSGQLPLKGRSLSRHYNDDPKNWDPSHFRKDSKDFSRRVNFDPKNNANQEFCQLEKVQIVRSNISCETIQLRLTLDYNSEEKKTQELGKYENKNVESKDNMSKKIINVIENNKIDLEETNKNDEEKCEYLKNEPNNKGHENMDEKSISKNEEKEANNEEDENVVEKNCPERKNIEDENKKLNKREYQNFPALSSLTHKKMDDLLKSLRERTNALNEHEGKRNGQFAGRTRLPERIHLETGTHEKSGSLANYAIAIGPEVRASFAERIQEIWLDHKNHWSIVGERKPQTFSEIQTTSRRLSEKMVDEEEIDKELEINNHEPENSAKIESQKKCEFSSKDRNLQTHRPIICHVGVQYELEEFKDQEKSLVPGFGWENKLERSIEMKIEQFRDFSKFIPPEKEEKKTTTFSDAERDQDCGKPLSEKNENPFSSSFSEDSSGSKKNPQKSSDPLNYRERKKLDVVLPKIRLRSIPNFHFKFPRNPKKNRADEKGLLWKKNWFSIKMGQRSRMRGKLSKLLAKSRTKSLRNVGRLARGLKKIFSRTKIKSAPNLNEDSKKMENPNSEDSKNSTGPSQIQMNEEKLSSERFPGSGGSEKSIERESPSQIQKKEEKLSSERFPPSGCCESSIERETSSPQLEHPKKIVLAAKSYGSMTKLSVTTSDSTNITLQLLGSTNDTRNVPSGELQLGLASRLVKSCSEIIKSDPPAKLNENSKNLPISPPPKIENPRLSREFSNIFEGNENPPNPKIDETTKTTTKSIVGEVEKLPAKKTIVRSRAKMLDLRSKIESEMKNKAMVRKDCPTTIMRTETLAKRVINKTSSSNTEKNLRLQRRKSVIDIKVDKLSSEQTKNKVDVPNEQAQRSRCSSRLSDSRREADPQKHNKIGIASGSIERSRQRKDSPTVPRTGIRTFRSRGKSSLIPIAVEYQNVKKKKNFGDPKNRVEPMFSLISSPPSLENILTTISKSPRKKMENAMEKEEKIEPDNFFPSPKSSESRKISKNTPPDWPNSKSKKIDNENRVHFEVEKDFPEEKKMDEKLDDVKISKRIKSSLETGVPLKRITITEPHVLPKKIERVGSIFEKSNFLVRPEDKSALNWRKNETASKSFDRVDKKKLSRRSYRHEPQSSRQIPRQTLEKCDSKKIAISYRRFEEKPRHRSNKKSEESESFENFSKLQHFEKPERSMIVDLTSIKEKLDNDIIERTSRTSGTEDNDCAIILIKAINSSMQLADD